MTMQRRPDDSASDAMALALALLRKDNAGADAILLASDRMIAPALVTIFTSILVAHGIDPEAALAEMQTNWIAYQATH